MFADAFSCFDYGSGLELVMYVSWFSGFISLCFVLSNSDYWMVNNSFSLSMKLFSRWVDTSMGSISGGIYGRSLFITGLGTYLAYVSCFSSFPYVFCVTAHFSHNLALSLVLWFTVVFMSGAISMTGVMSHSVPDGLPWFTGWAISLLELFSNLIRSLTLGARLSMNMIAGKFLLMLGSSVMSAFLFSSGLMGLCSVSGLCSTIVLLIFITWELAVNILQASIFGFLLG
uniref:F-ATPase protein 6 n=1 Tax=Nuttallia olivacea TaxID=1125678 RepID=J3JR29_9BIVA|nr:ATP synthase F0 subunit 6 [Nuttallia olivacea]AEV94300.1 ATPase subunit 6 [Nuttallia olivacea]